MNKKKDSLDAEKNLGKGLATATTGALVGAAIGGPVGAAVGGAVGPISDYIIQTRKRQIERAEALAEKSAELAGVSLEDLLKRLASDERMSDLGIRLLEIAAKSKVEERDNAMAVLLAKATKPENEVAAFQYRALAEILADLHSPHIQILLFIAENEPCDPDEILTRFPEFGNVMRSLVRTLELHGVIVDDNRLADPPTNEIVWSTSALGKGLIEIINVARKEIVC